jgi:hypothetical protein
MVRPLVALVTPGSLLTKEGDLEMKLAKMRSQHRGAVIGRDDFKAHSLRGVPRRTNLKTSNRATAPTKATKIVAAKPWNGVPI